jgi:AcrR family transcriptional regulator
MSGQVVVIESERGGRRKPESLVRLRQAARKLFVERGYDATRPQDIAREAGLGHGTFYLHYPDKRACFLAFIEDAARNWTGMCRCGAARATVLSSTSSPP